jgi:hypothetical protein
VVAKGTIFFIETYYNDGTFLIHVKGVPYAFCQPLIRGTSSSGFSRPLLLPLIQLRHQYRAESRIERRAEDRNLWDSGSENVSGSFQASG